MESDSYMDKAFVGRNRRLLNEWRKLEERLNGRRDIQLQVVRRNADGLPTAYLVNYQLRSICGVDNLEHFGERGVTNAPVYATGYQMRIDIPDGYPSVDCPPVFRFLPGIRTSAGLVISQDGYASIWPIPIPTLYGVWNGLAIICATTFIMPSLSLLTLRT